MRLISCALQVEIHDGFGRLRAEMHDGYGQLRAEMHGGFGQLRAEISNVQTTMVRWGFVFWVGQAAAVAALVIGLLSIPR